MAAPIEDLPHAGWAEVYDTVYETEFGGFYQALTELTVDVVARRLEPDARVVDFGAGTGRLAIPLARRGFRVTAVDPCEPMLRRIGISAPESSIPCVTSTMQDFTADEPFDAALCVFTVVIYLLDEAELERAFDASARALRPGGVLLFDVPDAMLFGDRTTRAPGFERRVRMKPLGAGLYDYSEKISIGEGAQRRRYSDRFRIRAWSADEVLDACGAAGLHLAEDLTGTFAGTGSRYFVLRKD